MGISARSLLRISAAFAALVLADIGGVLRYSGWCEREARDTRRAASDAAIVFYGDEPPDRDRLGVAMAAWRAGEASHLYFVGGARSWGSGAALMAAESIALGAPASIVNHDLTSFDTETNVLSACAAIAKISGAGSPW